MVTLSAVVVAAVLGVTLYLLDRADAQTPRDLRSIVGADLDELRSRFGRVQDNVGGAHVNAPAPAT